VSATSKSQWDFGELFPPEQLQPQRKVWTVAALTWQIRNLLERELGEVWVTGEVTNLKTQSSGHIYFTLKDASAQLGCVLFRGELQVDRSLVQDGGKLVLRGQLTVYEARGQYQLRVVGAELQGQGALQAAFEKLKAKLNAEGLFATERKRPLPKFVRCVGLVTSPTGAAIRDVLHVIERRDPSLQIILAPCRVQGEGAGREIAAAIRLLNEFAARRTAQGPRLDLILVTRGGGSLEDLWAFNEEIVARAIYESQLPVVSAVGHEIDFTIGDFVADLRAATPSAAAEIITAGVVASCQFLAQAGKRIRQLAAQRLADKQYELKQAAQNLARQHPRRRFSEWVQRLDDLAESLSRCARTGLRSHRTHWTNLADRLIRARPAQWLKHRRERVDETSRRLRDHLLRHLREAKNRFAQLDSRLRLLGPEQVLARGYSITLDAETGGVLRDAGQVKAGQRLRTKLKKGEIISMPEAPTNNSGWAKGKTASSSQSSPPHEERG
jgi:exodeoxyribonuclease VII large subunit